MDGEGGGGSSLVCVQTEDEVFHSQMNLRNTERKRALALTSVENSQSGDFDTRSKKKAKLSTSPELSVITEMKTKMENQAKEIAQLRLQQNQNSSFMSSMMNNFDPETPAGPSDIKNAVTAEESSGDATRTKTKRFILF